MLIGGLPYCTRANLANYLPAATLALATDQQKDQACLDASEEADSYMRGRYALPMSAVGNDVVMYCSWMACYHLMNLIGWPPQANSDSNIRERYYKAVGWPDKPGTGWFPGIQRQTVHPDVTPAVAQPGDAIHDVPQVHTSQQRGWQTFRGGKPTVQ
jgi:phage gp36-like protein